MTGMEQGFFLHQAGYLDEQELKLKLQNAIILNYR
jgi:hypothetical protein